MSGPPAGAAGMVPPNSVTVNIHPLTDGELSDDPSIPTAALLPSRAAPQGSPKAPASPTGSAGAVAGAAGLANGLKPRAGGSSDDGSGQDTDTPGDQTAAAAAAAARAAGAPSTMPAAKLTKRLSSRGSRGSNGGVSTPKSVSTPKARKPRRLVHLQSVVQDTYEYHGMNDLVLFLLFGSLTSLVLFFHWPSSTAIFKNSVQNAFSHYGNPDWQQQTLAGQDNMFDGLEYITGFLEFYIKRTTDQNFTVWNGSSLTGSPVIRIGEYAEIKYARLLVNLDNNCNKELGHLECYKDPGQDMNYMQTGQSMLETKYNWSKIDSMDFRMSTHTGTPWLSYTLIAPTINNQTINPTLALERLFNVTSQTTLANDGRPGDVHPDIKPYLSRFAYSITLDLLAVNVLGSATKPDMAIFSMQMQRSDVPSNNPDRAFWQITTTVPARTAFYGVGKTDTVRAVMEALTVVALCIVTYAQIWQLRVVQWQHNSVKPYWVQFWNIVEALSTISLFVWIAYYAALVITLNILRKNWKISTWDEGRGAQEQLDEMEEFANWYSGWLYGAILVNAVVVMRLVRYMRIHAGLKAFYQVFIIAAREFADFGVFLVYILLLLGLSIFAFFQLTGGNWQFLRFSDGISVMTRLTFGFLDYIEFQQYALGLGTAVAAVTFLFWVAVLLLVVYTQNIILAIVAEAYERAKAEIGTARVSFITLVFQRLVFACVFLVYWLRLAWRAATSRSKLHEEEMYRDIVANAANMRSRAWRYVALRRWAAWALCRTASVKSLANLYQDYASLKLKRSPPWLKADDILKEHLLTLTGPPASPLGPKDPSVDDAALVALPELGEGTGYVDQAQLEALFRTAADMRHLAGVWPCPFIDIDERTIETLVAGIMVVYGFDAEEDDQAYSAANTASGASSDGGGGGGLRPAGSGSLGPWNLKRSKTDLATGARDDTRRGGFLKRLNSIRNGADTTGAGSGTVSGGGGAGNGGVGGHSRSRPALRQTHRLHEATARSDKQQAALMEDLKRQLKAQRAAAEAQARVVADTNANVAAIVAALGLAAGGVSSGVLTPPAAGASPLGSGSVAPPFGQSPGSVAGTAAAAMAAAAAAAGVAGGAAGGSRNIRSAVGAGTSRRSKWGMATAAFGGHGQQAAQQQQQPAQVQMQALQQQQQPAGQAGPSAAAPDAAAAAATAGQDAGELAAQLASQQAVLERILDMLQLQQQQQQQQPSPLHLQSLQQRVLSPQQSPQLTRAPSQYPPIGVLPEQ